MYLFLPYHEMRWLQYPVYEGGSPGVKIVENRKSLPEIVQDLVVRELILTLFLDERLQVFPFDIGHYQVGGCPA